MSQLLQFKLGLFTVELRELQQRGGGEGQLGPGECQRVKTSHKQTKVLASESEHNYNIVRTNIFTAWSWFSLDNNELS